VRRLDRICAPLALPPLGSPLPLLRSQHAVGARSSSTAWSGGFGIFHAADAVLTEPSMSSTDERHGKAGGLSRRPEEKPPPELARAEEEQPHDERAGGDGRLHVPRRGADEPGTRRRPRHAVFHDAAQSVAGFMLQLRAGRYIARVLPFFLPSFNLRQLGALGIWGSD
jgi:hypothetical protein